jgi:hypothetical protein
MDNNYMSTVDVSSAWYSETYCINHLNEELNPICHSMGLLGLHHISLFPKIAFSSDHNNNLKWAILGT